MTPQELIDALSAPGADKDRLLRTARLTMTPTELEQVANNFLVAGDAVLGGSISAIANEMRSGDIADEAAETALAETQSTIDAAGNNNGTVDPGAEQDAATQAGAPSNTVSEADQALAGYFSNNQIPSDAKVEELLAFIEDWGGGSYNTWDEFYNSPAYEDPEIRAAAAALGFQEEDPTTYTFSTTGRERDVLGQVTVTRREMEYAQEYYPIADPADLGKFVRLASSYGMKNSRGEAAWQPFMALLNSSGYFAQNDARASSGAAAGKEFGEASAELKRLEALPYTNETARLVAEARKRVDAAQKRLQGNAQDPNRIAVASRPGDLARAFNDGMGVYNDPFLAFIHAQDEGLALRASGAYDAKEGKLNLSRQDQMLMAQILVDAVPGAEPGSFIDAMVNTGFGDAGYAATAAGLLDMFALNERLANGGGGGAGAQRTLPDRDAVKQGAKDFYRQMFLQEPSDQQLESFTNSVYSTIAGAPDNESVDATAQIRKIAEALPEYQKYYGNKPAGMTEMEYQSQFANAQQSILGAELADNQAVRVGMQDGAYQTTVGAAAGTKEAADNSTFQGNLARAAQSVAAFT